VNDMPLRLSNSTIDADDTTLPLSANWNDITSLTHSLMYFRRKDQSITRPTNIEHHKLLGFNY